ncbi:hypothetical protein U879_21175 [Defluviimonas sp. 20V17]|nr:hypothetical protein U879_21175 [Defluviimonas sp. 20V17]
MRPIFAGLGVAAMRHPCAVGIDKVHALVLPEQKVDLIRDLQQGAAPRWSGTGSTTHLPRCGRISAVIAACAIGRSGYCKLP